MPLLLAVPAHAVFLVPPGEDGVVFAQRDGVPAAARDEDDGLVGEGLDARRDGVPGFVAVAELSVLRIIARCISRLSMSLSSPVLSSPLPLQPSPLPFPLQSSPVLSTSPPRPRFPCSKRKPTIPPPHVNKRPSALTAAVWYEPHVICTTSALVRRASTGRGTYFQPLSPCPSLPSSPRPQAYAEPFWARTTVSGAHRPKGKMRVRNETR